MEWRADEAVGGAFFGIMGVCGVVGAVAGYLTVGGVVGGLVLGTLIACVVGRQFLQGGKMDRQKVEEFFERIVRRRAERLGISLEEAAKVPNAKPLFLEAAEERARLEGKTTEQVLAEYRQRLEDSTYPTDECLTEDEALEYGESGAVIPAERAAHVQACNGCRTLLEMSFRPREVSVEAFLARVRNA